MSAREVFTFAVYPSAFDDSFEAFLVDVPSALGEGAAARRAWWTACAILAGRGFEPEDFNVCAWRENAPGPLVTSAGFEGEEG